MMRSLFAGVSALRNHQLRMDVIGNNIANVNTIGFKASTVTFKEQLAQTLKGAGAPQRGRGGTNPQQVGLGVDVGAITNIHTQGNLQSTGVESDVAIEGNGFFILSDGTQTLFTRSGAFDFDSDGSLVSLTTGLKVMGYVARNGQIDVRGGLRPIQIPLSTTIPPTPTTTARVMGNLDSRTNARLEPIDSPVVLTDPVTGDEARVTMVLKETGVFGEWTWEIQAAGGTVVGTGGRVQLDAQGNVTGSSGTASVQVGGTVIDVTPPAVGGPLTFSWSDGTSIGCDFTPAPAAETTMRVFDSLGNEHDLFFELEKTGENAWVWQASDINGNLVGSGTLAYDTAGGLLAQTGTISLFPAGADPLTVTPDFSEVTQYAEASDISKTLQNGFPSGKLSTISIDTSGQIHGAFSNGLSETLAQIALADFSNPAGLVKAGSSTFTVSANSGEPDIGLAGTGSRGTISPGSLEMSNVDLSQEFTNMIVTQRGFQANSRIITTSDEMLQELVNLKR